jgi:holliday junction DNA helicase RuvA
VIAHVTGRVVTREPERLVLDVGGIGLELASTRSAERLASPGAMVTVETYLHVREDALQLFGFADAAERALFRLLMGVSGIGPKLALAIVSAYGPEQLQRAIAGQDVALLASVSGVGRKTAQRICVDLKDKVGGVGAVALANADAAAAVAMPVVPNGADLSDPYYGAREALVALGYALADCEAALDGVDGTEDERVRAALARLRGAVAR